MIAARDTVEPLSHSREDAYLLEAIDGHQDAQEKEYRRHVDVRQQACDTVGCLLLDPEVGIEQLGGHPQQTQDEQDAHERRQVGEIAEDGDEYQSAHSQHKDCLALPCGQLLLAGGDAVMARLRQVPLQAELQQEGGHQH